jgi:hypothetical protein
VGYLLLLLRALEMTNVGHVRLECGEVSTKGGRFQCTASGGICFVYHSQNHGNFLHYT